MRNGLIRVGCAMLVAAALLPATGRAASLDSLLQQADELRSRDPVAFASVLDQIDQRAKDATSLQLRQARLLRAYQKLATGKYDAAVKDAVEIFKESKDVELKYRAALLVANGAAVTRDFSLGLRYLETALGLADQLDKAEHRHWSYLVAAVLYNQYGQFGLGQHYADRLLGQETSDRTRCFARQLRAESRLGVGLTLVDEREIDSAVLDCSTQKEAIAANQLRGYLAQAWAARGEPERAIALLESHMAEVEATRYPRLVGAAHGMLAEYRLMIGDVEAAEREAQAALKKGGKDEFSLPLVMAHKVLYQTALKKGDLKRALDEYRQYAEADKARLDEVKAREFAFQLSRHELQQKTQAIELLSRQNEVLRLQQEVSKTSAQNNQLLVAMLLMILGVGAYWAYKIKRVQVMFRKQAQVDSLTGVSNRGHFREQAEAQLARCQTTAREAALVLLDLDYFKNINDSHGHATGDWVLTQVAAACRAACREGDLFGRLGGEEFAILTCGGDLQAAERIAQQCRANIAAIDTSAFEHLPEVTASFGCASTKLAGHGFDTLFMHADRAMYRAKAEGRDRICSHEERPVLVRTQQVTA